MKRFSFVLLLAAIGLIACGRGPSGGPGDDQQAEVEREPASPNAHWDTVKVLREDLGAKRDPSDGGGKAWIEPGRDGTISATAGATGRWTIIYETGPLGIAEGGMIFLQVSPFWGWSTPQAVKPDALGYTTVATEAKGVRLKAHTFGGGLFGIKVSGRGLEPGERVTLTYGAGRAGALADRYAEHGSRFWIAVDGDGDGVRKILKDSPKVDVGPNQPARLLLTLPSTARVGQTVRLTVAVLDAAGNAGCPVEGEVALIETPPGLIAPSKILLHPEDEGSKTVELKVEKEGIYRLRAKGPGTLTAESNPLLVAEEGMRILWGDLQIHSNISDGTGTPEDIFLYARDVAGLDVAALTDHDHWGMLFLDQNPDLWEEIREQTARFHEPERFVTLLGFEWTSWIHGHRHVLYSGDEGEVISSLDPRYDEPEELWRALRGRAALTVAHHSAGEPVAVNWSIPPDPDLEPVTEIVSIHGSSEAADSPSVVAGAIPGNFVRDALDRGYRMGFIGSGDGHDGHPGLTHLGARTGGLAAILSEKLTRAGVLEALRARRVYATSGPRIILRASLSGRRMGSILTEPSPVEELKLMVVAPAPIEKIDIIRSGGIAATIPAENRRQLFLRREIRKLHENEYLYVRVVLVDGGLAWSSPFFISGPAEHAGRR
jgi:hypothetical protein